MRFSILVRRTELQFLAHGLIARAWHRYRSLGFGTHNDYLQLKSCWLLLSHVLEMSKVECLSKFDACGRLGICRSRRCCCVQDPKLFNQNFKEGAKGVGPHMALTLYKTAIYFQQIDMTCRLGNRTRYFALYSLTLLIFVCRSTSSSIVDLH